MVHSEMPIRATGEDRLRDKTRKTMRDKRREGKARRSRNWRVVWDYKEKSF